MSDLKQLMSNEIFREQLMSKVYQDMAKKVAQENKPKRKFENKTSELRRQAGHERRLKNEESFASIGIQSATNTFSQRSRSVLPPIATMSPANKGNGPTTGRSPYARKGSLDYNTPKGAPRMDSYSEARSVYKLDPNMSEPQQANSVSGRKNVTPGRNSGSGMKATNFKTQASPQ